MVALLERADYTKVQEWTDADKTRDEIDKLVNNPPLHSIVVKIWPEAAQMILDTYNTHNRKKKDGWISSFARANGAGGGELTGEAIKFGLTGRLLDGQNRLHGTAMSEAPFTTHVTFGIDDKVFDVLDQGTKRTPSDILHLSGVQSPTMTAAAVRWAEIIERREANLKLTPREHFGLLQTKHKKIVDYLEAGRSVNAAFKDYKIPPSFVAALAYTVGRKDEALAKQFVYEWIYSPRIDHRANFDTLRNRLQQVTSQSGGKVNPTVRAALIIQTFNAWNAGVTLSSQALRWQTSQKFPALILDGDEYMKMRVKERAAPRELTDHQKSVLAVLFAHGNGHAQRHVQRSLADIAKEAKVAQGSVRPTIKSLEDLGHVRLVQHATERDPAVYQLLVTSEDARA